MASNQYSAKRNLIVFILLTIVAAAIGVASYFYYTGNQQKPLNAQTLETVQSVDRVKDSYDVIVVGTDPEGIMAAVSAARNGLSTLLVEGREERTVLGGLMTVGWLNSVDHNYDRKTSRIDDILNKGLFEEWYKQVEGDSFDVTTAANVFYRMVKNEPNIDLYMNAKSVVPLLGAGKNGNKLVTGIELTKRDGAKQQVAAKAVIDATQDADFAAAAGVPFTIGREDIGDPNSRMAVTLVFRMKNVTPDVWEKVKKRLRDDGDPNTDANERSAWGYTEMQKYPPVNKERTRMRGLNIGRQNDGTILINALQIFGIDALDPKSRAEAFEIARNELPHVVAHMKQLYPEFAGLELDGTAPELYVRETRHMIGEYRLTMIDVLENRDQWDRIAFGSYPVDIQRISPTDNGAVMSHPVQYAIPFRSIVPLKVDGLLVVGRSASFDTLPHGSARVIPVGAATGEAAGAAARIAIDNGVTFREMAASKELIALLQNRLNEQGMELHPFSIDPLPYMKHKAYPGLKVAVSMGLTTGGYNNDFRLDEPSNPQRMVNQMLSVRRVMGLAGDPSTVVSGIADPTKPPLTLDQAAWTIAKAAGYDIGAQQAVAELTAKGLLKPETVDGIADKTKLTNGDTFMMIKDFSEGWPKK